ncbi:MAG: glycosyltransferase family 1 protein, partial [Actinomycetota bacterium]
TVVASAHDGYRNVATDDRDALLTPPGDSMALAHALRRALTDTELADRLCRAGSARASEFAMGTLVDHYLERYEAVSTGR